MIKDKLKTRNELSEICDRLRNKGLKIGFTSGTFDFIHAGHADYLEKAKEKCDVLIVAVNSDQSVKKYKGSDRPIVNEKFRTEVVAALEAVDYVFLFDERRNRENIEKLKPDYYFKAGDYQAEQLTSKEIVEQYGGTAQIIPVTRQISTTEIIDKIARVEANRDGFIEEIPGIAYFHRKPGKMSPAIFLDRDGTINKNIGYLSEPEKLELLPNVLDGLKKMYHMGYRLVIITNQQGIGLGYFTKEDFYQVNKRMLTQINAAGIKIDKIYFCPHSMSENCDCRKPNIKLFEQAKIDLNIDMSQSYFIGDAAVDIEAGKNAGVRTILIRSDFVKNPAELEIQPDFMADDLLQAASIILEQERKK